MKPTASLGRDTVLHNWFNLRLIDWLTFLINWLKVYFFNILADFFLLFFSFNFTLLLAFAIFSSLRFRLKLFEFKFASKARSLSYLVQIDKSLIWLLLTFYKFCNNFCKKFLFLFNFRVTTATLLGFRVLIVDDILAHFLSKYHLFWRENSCDGGHIKSHTIKEPFQVKFFVNLCLSFFKKMSVAFAGLTIISETLKVARWTDALCLS